MFASLSILRGGFDGDSPGSCDDARTVLIDYDYRSNTVLEASSFGSRTSQDALDALIPSDEYGHLSLSDGRYWPGAAVCIRLLARAQRPSLPRLVRSPDLGLGRPEDADASTLRLVLAIGWVCPPNAPSLSPNSWVYLPVASSYDLGACRMTYLPTHCSTRLSGGMSSYPPMDAWRAAVNQRVVFTLTGRRFRPAGMTGGTLLLEDPGARQPDVDEGFTSNSSLASAAWAHRDVERSKPLCRRCPLAVRGSCFPPAGRAGGVCRTRPAARATSTADDGTVIV
ncbi:hypothetical protein C8Q79DRAFT_722436 [Trametes meyenii]|nr:hypothetical protein C8Q79DRAFT_722436 [Trametes meyenii]